MTQNGLSTTQRVGIMFYYDESQIGTSYYARSAVASSIQGALLYALPVSPDSLNRIESIDSDGFTHCKTGSVFTGYWFAIG